MALLGHTLQYVSAHHGDYQAMRRRHAHVFSMFEAWWHNTENDDPEAAEQHKVLRDPVIRAVDNLSYYLLHIGEWPLMTHWRPRLQAHGTDDARTRGHRAYKTAILAYNRGDFPEARRLLSESIAVKEDLGDRSGRAASLHQLAIIEHDQGNLAETRRLSTESIALLDELGDHKGRAASLHQLAIIEHAQGNFADARRANASSPTSWVAATPPARCAP